MIVLNLKNYEKVYKEIDGIVAHAEEIRRETGIRIILCPPMPLLAVAYADKFSQHADVIGMGQSTGVLPISALPLLNVKGSLLNHSERRVLFEEIKKGIDMLKKEKLESIVCAENDTEVRKLSALRPTYVAVEPPELIGKGVSVSRAKPDLIKKSVDACAVPLLCGAGVSTKEDVRSALEYGAKGVLLASAFVNAKNRREFLRELCSCF